MTKRCGDFGGVNGGGQACKQYAGAGTDHKGEGRCHKHTEEADVAMQANKSRVVEVLGEATGSLIKAAYELKVNPVTIWRWRKSDPEWDKEVSKVIEESEARRAQTVEDALFARLIAGKASAAEVCFYLCNRAPERWKHVQRVEHTGRDGKPIQTEAVDLTKLSDKELTQFERLIQQVTVAN